MAWPAGLAAAYGLGPGSPLGAVVAALKPTAVVGVSGVAGLLGEDVVREMAGHVERPVVLLLSGPTSPSEASAGRPAGLDRRTGPRRHRRHRRSRSSSGGRTVTPGHGSNALVFPGVGLGVLVSEARTVSDAMFVAAAEAVAGEVSDEDAGKRRPVPAHREAALGLRPGGRGRGATGGGGGAGPQRPEGPGGERSPPPSGSPSTRRSRCPSRAFRVAAGPPPEGGSGRWCPGPGRSGRGCDRRARPRSGGRWRARGPVPFTLVV